jgi:hypothetical protein
MKQHQTSDMGGTMGGGCRLADRYKEWRVSWDWAGGQDGMVCWAACVSVLNKGSVWSAGIQVARHLVDRQ